MPSYNDIIIGHYGEEHQLKKACEECAELIVAITHHFEGRENAREEIKGEITDVEIMLGQIKQIFGITAEEVGELKAEKMLRQLRRVKCAEQHSKT